MRHLRGRLVWGLGMVALLLASNCGGGPAAPSVRDAETLTREGWVAFEAGEFARAVAEFDSAQKADPDLSADRRTGRRYLPGRPTLAAGAA